MGLVKLGYAADVQEGSRVCKVDMKADETRADGMIALMLTSWPRRKSMIVT